MVRLFRHRLAAMLVVALGLLVRLAAQPLTRTAATSLQLPVAPPSTTFTTQRVFPGVTFSQPLAVVSPPGDNRRLFVVEKGGRIWVIPDVTAAAPTRLLFLDLTARVAVSSNDERGLLALAFHPDYATNGQFFTWYTLNATTSAGTGLHERLARFRVSPGDLNAADPNSEQPLITQRDEASNHNGGEIAFGPDGYLYLSLGDEGGGNDQYQNSQRIDRDFFSGIIRIDVDQRLGSLPPNPHASVHLGTYSIPADNPFVGAVSFNGLGINPGLVRTEFWAVGLRNPWRMSFDSVTGQLWCGDVGQGSREEINLIVRGGNYGWAYREGLIARPGSGTPPAAAPPTFIAPIWDYPNPAQGQSVTGGFVYRGSRISALYGHYLFADYASGRIWSLRPDESRTVSADRVRELALDGGIASFGLDPSNGDILLADLSEGVIKRLVPATGSGGGFPATLTATGVFSNLGSLTPAAGVVAYEPNVSFWSDHATKRRWFALRDTTSTFGFSAESNWTLPTGAVWVKHFDLETTRGNPATARRIETRFLVKTATEVYGLTYRWNDAQTEATLVPDEGADTTFTITENGVARQQAWHFPARAECLTCHTQAGGFALSFSTRQLNREHTFPGGSANILTALAQAGYLSTGAPPAPASLPALARASDLSKSLEQRARSYLDANCAQCHQPGGTALGYWEARATTTLAATGLINGPLADSDGDPLNRVLAPGDAAHSRVLQRMMLRGAGQMPPLATRERDRAGESLVAEWIAALGAEQTPSRLINLAARAQVDGGNQLIAGFVIERGTNRSVLIRGVGPGLAQFGLPSADLLAQPSLTLTRGAQTLASNARWSTAPNAEAIRETAQRVGAFPLPAGAADTAILTTLAPGNYSAQVSSATAGGSGLAIVEVYDAGPGPGLGEPAGTARLINTSVRARVGTGASILIPGLVIGEGAVKTVLIRAVGPGLAQFGVTDFVAEPTVALFAGSQQILANRGWNGATNVADLRAATRNVGAFALTDGSRDSALLITLPPGSYTIHVGGANATTGVALVEVYEVP